MDSIPIEPAAFFAALGDPTRLRLVELLARQRAKRALCVKALAHRLGVSQPAVSQHLQVLRGVGLVYSRRRGARVHYFLDGERLRLGQSFLGALADAAGGGAPPVAQGEGLPASGRETSSCAA